MKRMIHQSLCFSLGFGLFVAVVSTSDGFGAGSVVGPKGIPQAELASVHGVIVPLPSKDEIPSKVKNSLRSKYEKDRQGAIKKLAAIGTEEAWQLVLGALKDMEGQVADEAQRQLAGPNCPAKVWQNLLGTDGLLHRDEWVQLRAAEILARLEPTGPVTVAPFTKALSKKRPIAAVGILRALAKMQSRGSLDWGKKPDRARGQAAKQVDQLLSASAEIANEALLCLVELDAGRGVDSARKHLGSKSPLLRAAALLVLQRAEQKDVLAAAQTLVADIDGGVRSVAARVLQEVGNRAALATLIGRLEVEPREKLQLELLPRLQAMTGNKAGRQVSAWQRYLEDLPSDWQAVLPANESSGEAGGRNRDGEGGDRSIASGAGLPTHSDRIVYLLDFSGSIWNERKDGKTRKELLDPVFHATLDAQREGALFNVAPYTGDVQAWSEEIQKASARNVKGAHRFIDEIKISGPGDFYKAVQWAKLDPAIDTICVLTDGAPSGGRRWNMEWMADLLIEENLVRPLRFDVVLVDCPKGLQRHWEHLASATGGMVQTIDFKKSREK